MITSKYKTPCIILGLFSALSFFSCNSTKSLPKEIVEQTEENTDTESNFIQVPEESEHFSQQEQEEQQEIFIPEEKIQGGLIEPFTEELPPQLPADFMEPEVFDATEDMIIENEKKESEQEVEPVPDRIENPSIEEISNNNEFSLTVSEENNEKKKETVSENTDINTPVFSTEENDVIPPIEKTEETPAAENNSAETNSATDQNSESDDDFNQPAADELIKTPSRSMTCHLNQYIEVDYPGNGWIFIGEDSEEPLFKYFGRKLGGTNTKFTLRSTKSGKTQLHFYKNDVLTSRYIDDYLEVEVLAEKALTNEKLQAPLYADAVPPKPVRKAVQNTEEEHAAVSNSANLSDSKKEISDSPKLSPENQENNGKKEILPDEKDIKTNIQTTGENLEATEKETPATKSNSENFSFQENNSPAKSAEVTVPTAKLLEQAKHSLKEKQYEKALTEIQLYLDKENTKIDEALYVQGQILEADSKVRNIKNAIDSYDTIIKKYPASPYWQDANRRKVFLTRFYVNIY